MRTFLTLCLAASSAISLAQSPAPFSLSRTIPLPGVTGRFDHLAIDPAGNRLFIAATTNHSVEVIDLATDKVAQSITGLGKPHGLAWVAETGSLYVADGALGELRVYTGTPLAPAGKIKLSDDADDMVYDEAHHLLFVGHGGSNAANPARIAVVDTDRFALVSNLSVATHPEALEIDPRSGRVFANIAESNEVVVIDTAAKAIVMHWKLTKAADNVPVAFDTEHQLLYVACRTPGMVIALDAATGKEISSQPAAGGADDLFYDPALHRVYLISGAGEVDAYQVDKARNLHPLEGMNTAAGAKTALFVPAHKLLYVAVPGAGQNPAEIRVYSTPHAPAAEPAAESAPAAKDGELKFVVILSRHGVRSPTGSSAQYNSYSAAPWPAWSVAPGYLTAHGYQLMQIFGAYDRLQLSGEGLLSATGCEDAARVTFYADSDQRTRETGKALAAGLFPGCAPAVKGLPEGTPDALFHPLETRATLVDQALAVAAISGRIGDNPNNPTEAYRAQLTELDRILGHCGDPATPAAKRQSILEIPAKLTPGTEDHLADLRGPLSTASTLTENFLLEYTEGMNASDVGWGCVNGANLGSLLELHTVASEFSQRPRPIARAQASNLLNQVLLSLSQAATGKPVAGAISSISDRALFLIGHDTNIASIAGLLDLDWIADGRQDDTPPGGALVFELWHPAAGSQDFVRVYYTTQTLEQMRSAAVLTRESPPLRVPVFIPACSRADFSCSLPDFERALRTLTAESNP